MYLQLFMDITQAVLSVQGQLALSSFTLQHTVVYDIVTFFPTSSQRLEKECGLDKHKF